MNIAVCNPLLRTPLSLIVDDSCPVVNLTYYWIHQRHAWKARHQPGVPPDRWEGNASQLKKIPPTIPADFAWEWAEWCWENGVKGKFSLIPYPAGVGRVDEGFPDFPVQEYQAWLRIYREIIWPNFDLTPEMLTHTAVVDLDTFTLTEEWEQVEWVDPPVDNRLTDYIITAMEMLDNVGILCEGVTSPGAFGKRQEAAYAKAVLTASQEVTNDPRPSISPNMTNSQMYRFGMLKRRKASPLPASFHVQGIGSAVGRIHLGSADQFITEDHRAVACHQFSKRNFPVFLSDIGPDSISTEKSGFDVLKTVKARLNSYDPDGTKTLWMKNSEIGHYWMAREFTEITVGKEKTESIPVTGEEQINLSTQFPTANFTLVFD